MSIKRILSGILAFAVTVTLLTVPGWATEVENVIYSEDFEGFAVDGKPSDITVSGDKDSVYVDTVGNSKRLWLKNESDIKKLEISKEFSEITDKTITFELDFLQLYSTSDGDTILGIYNGDTPVVLIETNNGNIAYNAGTKYEPVISGYLHNVTYNIKVEVDLFAKLASVYADGEYIGRFNLLDESGTVDKLRIKSQYSPGFTVDNIKIYMQEDLNSIKISGDTRPVIPAYNAVEYEYTATVTDTNGVNVSDINIDWSLVNAPSGVSLAGASGNKVELIVDNSTAPATFSVKAKVQNSEISDVLSVSTQPLSASSIEVVGWTDKVEITAKDKSTYSVTYPSYRITGSDREVKTYKFKAKVLDQFGNEVENFGRFNWSLFVPDGEPELPDYVSINSNSGVVSVTKNPTKEQFIGIKAVSVDNTSVVGKTKVSLLDFDTYSMDKTRFESVIEHVESSLNNASNDKTPLMSDLYSRQTKAPVYLPMKTGEVLSSNVMSQSNLLRTMYNLSKITGDAKYKDRVDEIYRYMMTDGVVTSGVQLGWGGHITMDMQTGAPYYGGNANVTHEIKDIVPFVSPMLSDSVNKVYDGDTYNNGNGWGGFLVRAMFSGHAMGNLKTLEFERHWSTTYASYATALEAVWQDPGFFDDERRGPLQRNGGAAFTTTAADMTAMMLEYYQETGDIYALEWSKNMMQTILNSAITYYVYTDTAGNFIWPSDNDENFKREYYNSNNELVYRSVKTDSVMMDGVECTNVVYQHRNIADETNPDVVKVIDNNGNETELTLYNTWTEGIFHELATTKGMDHELAELTATLGYTCYLASNYKSKYTGPEYGDRVWNNLVHGTDDPTDKDTWVELGYITEEEGELMIDPYMGIRGMSSMGDIVLPFCDVINCFYENGDYDTAIALTDQFSKSMYNSLKLRYNFSTDKLDSYMNWIRPEYMRSEEITEYKELAWDEEYNSDRNEKHKRYLNVNKNMKAPHNGYYWAKGNIESEQRPHRAYPAYISGMVMTLNKMVQYLEATDPADQSYAENMEKAQLFRNRIKYLWKVLRDVCENMLPIGDIGEDFFNPEPNLDFSSTAYYPELMDGAVALYRATGHEDFLRLARVIANNYVRRNFNSDEEFFENGSDYFATTSVSSLPYLLELDAYLLDRYDENIKYHVSNEPAEFFDSSFYGEDGAIRENTTLMTSPSGLYPNRSVKANKINIKHDVIELNVGDSMVIDYEVLPYDADSKGVIWDVYDQRVAMINADTSTIYAMKKGKTKIRCVSTSRLGLASKEVEVIVK